jgi:hypothetical protein
MTSLWRSSTILGIQNYWVSGWLWMRLALSKGPNKVGVSLPSPEARNRSSFWNSVFSSS